MAKKKSEEEYNESKIKENFVRLSEKDADHAVEIQIKEKPSQEIIKFGKINKKRISKSSKKTKKKYWTEEFHIPGPKKLKDRGPILVITEKPQAAQKIADALADDKLSKKSLHGVPYYELEHKQKDILVVCAVGHLFTVAQLKPRNEWPTFEIGWAPSFLIKKKDFTKKYYDTIANLCKKAASIVVATDYDIEGEVIGMNIVRFICNQKDAERMKFSTLTSGDIKKAFENRSKTIDWKQGIAGETRHYIDWIYGINLSRALMDAIKSIGYFRLMSIGRVQGPALNIVVKKEQEIIKFKPEKYWQIFGNFFDKKNLVPLQYIKNISKEQELKKFENLEGKEGEAKTIKTYKEIEPPVPFDLTTLQLEAYRLYKITPSQTLNIAQRLYLAGIISYPRTSSQKLPIEIEYEKILARLKKEFDFVKYAIKRKPVEGKKKDPAHPAIYPTGEFHKIEGEDKKIYELIVKRFVSCFCESAQLNNKKIEAVVEGNKFTARGTSITKKGWMEVYPYTIDEKQLPNMDGKVVLKKIIIEEKITQPPRRYTPASIVSELEKKNLGTKATRASIIETLYERGYIKEKVVQATSLGISLIDTLEQNCPIIIDEKMTRDLEKELDSLRESKNPETKEKDILEQNKHILYKIGEHFKKNKANIGRDLMKATRELYEQEKKQGELVECFICKKGKLTIKYNQSSRRYFVACSNYPECKTTYSLPPNALIKRADKTCQECGFPMLISIRKAKRPWIFCFNPACPTRKDYQKTQKNSE